jgi:hypothetical protein
VNVDAAALDKCDQVRQYPTLHGWHDDCPPGVLCPHDQAVRLAASASASEFAQSCSSHVAIMGGIVSPWRESRHSARSFEMSSKSSAATQVHARSTAVNETSRVVATERGDGGDREGFRTSKRCVSDRDAPLGRGLTSTWVYVLQGHHDAPQYSAYLKPEIQWYSRSRRSERRLRALLAISTAIASRGDESSVEGELLTLAPEAIEADAGAILRTSGDGKFAPSSGWHRPGEEALAVDGVSFER